MPQSVKRVIVSLWAVLAVGTLMYFVYRSDSTYLKMVVFFGGFAGLFILVKSYLFKS